ncbi:DUF3800 domain-containing protein [Sporolactobacillus shoreicorticis]|uniref:DUF3800 domain-containing protein n=1 Tax=Sporolactobacillus shoreicorticis TaxID=1923877 RepID=A0ABW5S7N0_9BACL|nr:DUF3800 domain-containing protein [Sporolactobacillus shoreicorticis]MCO7128181.1 DUF3800 domain-containing protein [Sporolactobacillus shoreicorticis]
MINGCVYLTLDESGNLGRQGRYFTIACIEANTIKPLNNIIKKSVLKTKLTFPRYESREEIKASDSTAIIKDYFLRKIASKEIKIHYIVSDLTHVNQNLKDDENLLYNFMLKLLIEPIARRNLGKKIVINLDKRTIKVQSSNSFQDYIRLCLMYEKGFDIDIEVNYLESQNSYPIQAADFVANAVNTKYEYDYSAYFDILRSKLITKNQFPYRTFGV